MSGYVKELLLDLAIDRLSIDQRADLSIAIRQTCLSGVFSAADLHYLQLYLQGYTAQDIAEQHMKTTEYVEIILTRLFTAIEHYSGYTDDILINKVINSKKYRRSGIPKLQQLLHMHGKQFMTHELQR